MTVVSKELLKNGVTKYVVKCDLNEEELAALNGTFVDPRKIKLVIRHDADVYDESGKMLLRFRKGVLSLKNIARAYENMHEFAHNLTGARGSAAGSEIKDLANNIKIASNVMGYFDTWTVMHKHMFNVLGLDREKQFPVRITRFTRDHPDKWAAVVPLIRDIDRLYKKLAPTHYAYQKKHADETAFKIADTVFSTMTTNMNVTTAIHKDRGNLPGSFGNIVVIEKGKYDGGYTCYPQYGIGVDVRTGDFAAMSIHDFHGNTPIVKKTADAERLSLVCYLREGVWEKSKGTTAEDVKLLADGMDKIFAAYQKVLQKGKDV